MQLDEMIQWLIGVGASTGADCQSCLQTCIAMARQCGADEQQVDAATAIGQKVRQCAEKMAGGPKQAPPSAGTQSTLCCGFGAINAKKGTSE
jgi:hypothetical protein